MTAALNVEALRKQFSVGRPAVDGISFAVPAGEIVVLLGPSGCGKTTTLRCVAGLEHPSAGVISIGGRVVSSPEQGILLPPRQRDIGMVFQSYAVWPHMTVRQNVVYPLKHRRIGARRGRRAWSRRCWRWSACRNTPTGRWWRSPAGRCSASRWRAASSTGRSCCCSTSRCPTSTPSCACGCATTCAASSKSTGMTALYVTHDQSEAVVLGDRIGVMRDGKLLQMGTPDEIYNRPADLFVANFTGATNELTGTLVERNGDVRRGRYRRRQPRRGDAAARRAAGRQECASRCGRKTSRIGARQRRTRLQARVLDRRYQGTQTVYDIELFGRRLEVLELGTAARHDIGSATPVTLPRDACGPIAIRRAPSTAERRPRFALYRMAGEKPRRHALPKFVGPPTISQNATACRANAQAGETGRKQCAFANSRWPASARSASWRAANAAEPVKIRMSWVAPVANWASIILEKKDLAKHMGKTYTVEAVRYQGTPPMITAIANNELEVSNLAYSSLAIAIENAGLDDIRVIADEFQDGVPGYFTQRISRAQG